MAVEKFTAYDATVTTLIDSTSGAASSTSLYALGIGGYAYSAEVDNSTLQYPLGDIELAMSTTVTLAAPATLAVLLLPNVGSGNYAAASGNPGPGYFAGAVQLVAAATPQSMQILRVPLVTNKFKIVVFNNLGVALPSNTSSTLKLYRYGLQVV